MFDPEVEREVSMELTRKDLLCKGVSLHTGAEVQGWYCEGNVLQEGDDHRKRLSYIIELYPDLRKSSIGCVRLYGFIEVVPESVTLVERGE